MSTLEPMLDDIGKELTSFERQIRSFKKVIVPRLKRLGINVNSTLEVLKILREELLHYKEIIMYAEEQKKSFIF